MEINYILRIIKEFENTKVEIKEVGFIESMFYINTLKIHNEDDILYLKDENNGSYIILNINQIYDLNVSLDKVIIYLDNDINVEITK